MRGIGHIEKWVAGALGAVSLALIVNLVLELHGGSSGETGAGSSARLPAKASAARGVKGGAGKQKVLDELARYDPVVKQDLLKEYEDRPLPELRRDPFEFVAAPQKVSLVQPGGAQAPPPVPQPPPPPPVTLKLLGYSEGKGGVKEAMVSDEDQVYLVHEGDSVGTRYKIIKITPTAVTVQDATLHQSIDLPVSP